MLSRWSRVAGQLSKSGSQGIILGSTEAQKSVLFRNYASVSAASMPSSVDSVEKGFGNNAVTTVKLDKLFWSKPSSLALPKNSPLRIEEPNYEGIRRFLLKLMLFYTKESKSIRAANAIYKRVITQVDKPAIYNVFSLEKTFKTTFSLLVLHMWLCLRRLKDEGEEGVELGQYLSEIYSHNLELRVSKAGVNLLLTRWMRDLEKIFYGNIVAYNAALLPEAGKDDLSNVLWRNIFSEGPGSEPTGAAKHVVQAMTRYVRHELSCLSLTDKEAMFSGNFTFTSLEHQPPKLARP